MKSCRMLLKDHPSFYVLVNPPQLTVATVELVEDNNDDGLGTKKQRKKDMKEVS